ncbi:MAG: L,D-transpeptidase [Pseudomonadota bacterium]|nr:L,D-transpeptidase [Gammaproteobacteria bacterium]MBU1926589.1 L,D-transpeptidase [Gammaproteobacteria bacterium]
MQKTLFRSFFIFIICAFFTVPAFAGYGSKLCRKNGYQCVRVKRNQTWENLFPDAKNRDIVRRINRTNMRLRAGMVIAVPKNLMNTSHMYFSPMPQRIEPVGRRLVLINMRVHAFGAYDSDGFLVHWGPVSGGKGWCPDVGRRCTTPRGQFFVARKQGRGCISTRFPVGEGGAPMPYCMFFYRGFAMHGSFLPGYHASHGCVRLFNEDARWLNQEFVRAGKNGTKVIIQGVLENMPFYSVSGTLVAG